MPPAEGDGERSGEVLAGRARKAGVVDERVISALITVPRELFLPEQYRGQSWLDEPFPIGSGQTTSQPSLIARMIEALDPKPTDTVLDVGTGLGYQAALVGTLTRQVFSLEVVRELADEARRRIVAAGVSNVEVVCSDGTLGLPERAPFAGIIVGAATDEIPSAFREQLQENGRLVVPVRTRRGEALHCYVRRDGRLELASVLSPVRFVPLVREDDTG
jgi:protein-L-isoaspartate(D-aspartate) O-methyltransferase